MSFESDILNALFGAKNLKFYCPEHEPQSKSNLLKGRKSVQISRRKRYILLHSVLRRLNTSYLFRITTSGRI